MRRSILLVALTAAILLGLGFGGDAQTRQAEVRAQSDQPPDLCLRITGRRSFSAGIGRLAFLLRAKIALR